MIIDELFEAPQQCPECGGISFSDLILAEKKDACYYKVKASAKVWPSAYASGRLVQCRKKGAGNYGNKSEGVAEGKADYNFDIEDLKRLERIRDLATLKAQALALISKPSAKPMKPEKVEWFKNALENMNSPMKVIKLMYDLLLSGEGNAVVGTRSSMNPNSYRQRFGEQGVAEEQELDEKWSQKYKSSINCANPKGFSQKAHCAGRKKNEDVAEGEEPKTIWHGGLTISGPGSDAKAQQLDIEHELDEGGDVFMPNIKDTPEYKAGFATGKLPVPYPEGTQQYASYYKGVIDKASPTLSKVGEGEQQKGADYRDPKEVDYDDEYDAMVARVKKLAGLGPMKTVYDPAKRQYRNMPTAVQPKK